MLHVLGTADSLVISGRSTNSATLRIVELEPGDDPGALTNRPAVATVEKSGEFQTSIPRFDGARDRLYSSFATVTENPAETVVLGATRFVEEMRGVAGSDEPFPQPKSKKGLQVQMTQDALALGVQHAALNVNLPELLSLTNEGEILESGTDGETYYFRRAPVEALDRRVRTLSDAGVVVALILLNYESDRADLNAITLHPGYDRACPNRLSAFNTVTPNGLRYFKACLEFIGRRYSHPDQRHGRAVNFIIGNEVNSHWFWSNMGRQPMENVAEHYLQAVRVSHTAIRKFSSTARIYISLDHHWNIRFAGGDENQSFAARPFLDYFNRRATEQGNFDWHVAHHPYPENLGDCRTWNDKSATDEEATPRITFKNLQVLPDYLRRPELTYRGEPRRIILSEQGFHTADGPEGEQLQAAAFAYASYRTKHLPTVDSFIYHRHVDHRAEGGLRLGLWSRREPSRDASEPEKVKMIYEVFRAADTPQWEKAFAFALPLIGIKSWDEVRPASR